MSINWSEVTILIVEDDQDLIEGLIYFFNESGIKTFSALNGKEALKQIQKNKITVIISDLQMPVMDGAELLKNLNAINSKIPFIFITGQTHFTDELAASMGAKGIIRKPYAFKGLLQQIQNTLETTVP